MNFKKWKKVYLNEENFTEKEIISKLDSLIDNIESSKKKVLQKKHTALLDLKVTRTKIDELMKLKLKF